MPDDENMSEGKTIPAPPPAMIRAKQRRGFAVMDPDLVKRLAKKGGKAAHAIGKAHEFTSEEAREAGRKGGAASHKNRKRAPKKAKETDE